jgi:hypothetical protein
LHLMRAMHQDKMQTREEIKTTGQLETALEVAPPKFVAGLGSPASEQKPQAGRAQQRRLHCLVAGVERTWWRLCHLTLELRLVQTGVRFEKWADVVLSITVCWRCEVPPRRAPKKSQKNKFLSHVKWEFLIFFHRNDFSFRWKNSD